MITPLRATKHVGFSRRRRSTSATVFSATAFRLRPRLEVMEDRTLLSTLIVSNSSDSGTGSLRQAIIDSNSAIGATNTIDFHISGTGVQTIAPLSSLPAITNPVLIDGFSQRGYSGTPLIELSGSQAGTADGLTFEGSGSTLRGLDINGFANGAGIVITGIAATGNTIEANDIGSDPTGMQPLPNDFGVQILGGASNNLVGGATAAAGNLISFNNGPGVDVEGNGSVGNQITANRIFSNDRGSLHFDGTNDVILPNDLISGFEQEETIEASFQTTSDGVILGYQTTDTSNNPGSGGVPALYVGTDGLLYDGLSFSASISSIATVADGRWHQVALVADGQSGTEGLYLDGQLVGSDSGGAQDFGGSFNQIGTGKTAGYYPNYYPNTNGGWFGFTGQIADVRIWSVARTAAQVQQDMTTAPSATEPGLEADYPLGEEEGPTAHDLTSNHNDGTLSGLSGDFPTWGDVAIDLGDDGITHNSPAPRLGPNNYQNFPIVVTTADGGLEGWLSGSTPDTTFRIDVFASAGDSPEGAGQAQEDLGSLPVMTDSQGQAVFDIPFTPPANLPIVTATATDPDGNTSEVSALREAAFKTPTGYVPAVAGKPLRFSAGSVDAIAIQDPAAGPLEAAWSITLDVPTGTLTLSSLDGLVGTGDGTGSLSYRGALGAVNAALANLTYTSAPGYGGTPLLSLAAESEGSAPVQSSVKIAVSNDVVGQHKFEVTTAADSGPGSLLQAIIDSNAATNATNTIDFDISGAEVQTIAPLSSLPPITTSALIDGWSQPGYSGTPLIELSGSQAGGGDGLVITASNVFVRGLDIQGQRISISLNSQYFGEELIVETAPNHLAS